MGKISPVSIKYMVYADFEAEGSLEKPDVIGALFGQTEGLLGSDLEMRELQKEGKIGRIEVELRTENSKTIGKIQIPSALDKTETTLIAAAIETIERIGPSNAKIKVDKIEDVRENKRNFILERAKKLLEGIEEKMPKAKEMSETVKVQSRESKIKEYGVDKLPAGNVEGKEIIIVEGRADVVNLLRNGVDNVIAMNGTILPGTIKELSYDKEVTLFLDGDRGGKLIARNVIDNARVDYVAVAPDGKEVEELQGKEILIALRRKMPVAEYLKEEKRGEYKSNYERREYKPSYERREYREEKIEEKEEVKEIPLDDKKAMLKGFLNEVEGSRNAVILDGQLENMGNVPIRGIFSFLSRARKKGYVIIVDSATPNVIRAAEDANVKNVVAKNFSASSDRVNLISL